MNHIAQVLNTRAKSLAADYLRTEGELLSVLIEMRRERAFASLNFTGVFDYCERALRLSRAQAYYFKTVAEKAETVPELKQAIVDGEITLSQARRIAPVVTIHNHEHWIAEAKSLSQPELERRVAAENPKAHIKEKIRPITGDRSELKVLIDEETEKNLRVLKDTLSQKLGRAASLADVVAWAAKVTREKFDPERRAQRALKRSISLGNGQSPKPGRHRVAAPLKHEVIRRSGSRCSHLGHDGQRCEQRRWLHLHHIVPVASGGLNHVDNLQLRCSAHHALAHRSLCPRPKLDPLPRLGDTGPGAP